MGGKARDKVKKDKNRILDKTKQQLWNSEIEGALREQFVGASIPEIEKQLLKMKKAAYKELEDFKRTVEGQPLIRDDFYKEYRFENRDDYTKWLNGQREKTPLGYFLKDREDKLANSFDKLLELCSLVKSGEANKTDLRALSEKLKPQKSLTARNGYFEYTDSKDLDEIVPWVNIGNRSLIEFAPREMDHYVYGGGSTTPQEVKAGKTEKQIYDILDRVTGKINGMTFSAAQNGQLADHETQVASALWDQEIKEYLKTLSKEPKEVYFPGYSGEGWKLVPDDDRNHYFPGKEDAEKMAEMRLDRAVKDIFEGKLVLPGIDPKTMKPDDVAEKLAEGCGTYTFMTERERACAFFGLLPNHDRIGKDMLQATSEVAKMSLADINKTPRYEITEILGFPSSANGFKSQITNSRENFLKTIKNKIKDGAYSDIRLSDDYEENAKTAREKAEEFRETHKVAVELDKDNGKEELAKAQAQNVKLTESYESLYSAVRSVRGADYSKERMLSFIMEGLSSSKEPEKAREDIINMADGTKRSFWQKVFFRGKNKHSTKLRTMLTDLADKRQDLTPEQLDELRTTAEDLKYSIDKGAVLNEEGKAKLSDLDKKRYKLANKVLDSLQKSVHKEKTAQQEVRKENESPKHKKEKGITM